MSVHNILKALPLASAIFLFGLSGAVKAQCPPTTPIITGYTFSTGVGTASDWLTPSLTYSSLATGDDSYSSLSNLGFTFTFEGTAYTQFSVNTNGNFRLGSTQISASYYSTPFSTTNVAYNYPKIVPIGADLYGTTLTYGVSGSAPNRIGVYTFLGYPLSYSSETVNFQIHLYEATGQIKMIYRSGPSVCSRAFQIGIEGANTNNVVTVNTSSNTKTNGATSNTNTTYPGQYRWYSFVPPQLTCPGITNLAVAGSTVTWSECGTATQWEVEYGRQGFAIGNGTRVTVNNTPTYTLSGLNAGTVYDVYVRSFCAPNDQSSWKKTSMLYGVTFCGGNGTQANPYLICTEQDLRDLSNYVNMGVPFSGVYFRLANNIILTQGAFIPIGSTAATPFSGTFYGSNHSITNLTMNGTTSTLRGLFGMVKGAYIDSLTVAGTVTGGDSTGSIVGSAINSTIRHCVSNANVTGAYQFHGGIVGSARNSRIEYCTNNAMMVGIAYYHGGIVGAAYDGTVIRGCKNAGNINNGSAYYTGGIVGYMNGNSTSSRSAVHSCINAGEIRGSYYTGGVAGYAEMYCTVDSSSNINNVFGTYDYCGGIAGRISTGTEVRRCSNRDTVYSNSGSYTGGIVGYAYASSTAYCYIEYCVNSGDVISGAAYTAGIVGYLYYGYCQYNSNSADVIQSSTNSYTGGICGYASTYGYLRYSLNGGLVISNGNYVGGITGYSYGSSYTTYCLNVNNATGGPTYTYVAAIAGTGAVSNCYWDVQMCPTSNLYGTTADPAYAKTTAQLIGVATYPSTTYFTAVANMYPIPNGITDSIGARLAATPIYLVNNENVGTIQNDFTVCTANNVTWRSSNPFIISINAANAIRGALTGTVQFAGITADSLVKHINGRVITYPTFCGGSGTQADPYLICNPKALDTLAQLVNIGVNCAGLYFKVTQDLDMSGYSPWTPIGAMASTPFSGHFDGNNKTISNITINRTTDYQGLFGYVVGPSNIDKADIHHLTLRGSISGGSYTGGIVGYATYTNLRNLKNYANIGGSYSYHGGIAGYNYYYCRIDNCENYGTVVGSGYTGGITGGQYYYSSIRNSKNYGDITTSSYYNGGISGYNYYYDTIVNCINTGNVSGTSYYIGGIAGYKYYYGYIQNCENRGDVTGSYGLGGIVGYMYSQQFIQNCTNSGDVTGTSYYIGGIAGYYYSGNSTLTSVYEIRNCTNRGDVSGTYYIGGISGYSGYCRLRFCNNYGAVTSSSYGTGGIAGYMYYYGLVSGCNNYGDVTSTYNGTTIASATYGTGGIVGSFNYGTTVSNTYTIDSCNNYGDVTSAAYMTGGIVGESYYYTGSTRKCNNYGNVRGTNYVGGITGFHQGTSTSTASYAPYILSCANAGNVSGTDYVGGIVGRNGYTTSGYNAYTQECVNIGSVSGTNYVGGICGYNYGYSSYPSYVRGCLNAGSVTATNYAGGICGYTYSTSYAYTQYNINAGYLQCSGTYKGGVDGYSYAPTGSYYDTLMCPMPNWYYSNNNASYAKRTSYLTSGSFNPSATYFTAEAGMYPRPTTLLNNTIAILAATPVFLDETNPTNHVKRVNSCFSVGMGHNVSWYSSNSVVASITGSVGVPLVVDTVKAIAVKDSIRKEVNLNVVGLPQISATFTYNPDTISDTTGRYINIVPATNQYSNGCTFFSNNLPRGLSLDSSTGAITGIVYDELYDTIEVKTVCSGCFVARALIPYKIFPEAPCKYDSLRLPAGFTWYYDSAMHFRVPNNTVYADQRIWVYTNMDGRIQPYLIQPKLLPTARIYGDTTVCVGDSARLKVIFTGTAPYYYRITGDVSDRVSNSDTAYITVSPTVSSYYFVTYMRFEVCEAMLGNLTGRALVNICGEQSLCDGDSVVFTSGTWFSNSTYTIPVQGNVAHPTTTTMYYNRDDGSALKAVVYPRPTATIPTGYDSICNGACIDLPITFTGTAPFHYRLTGDTVDRVCNRNSDTLHLCPNGSIVYRILTLQDVYCDAEYQDRNGAYDVNVCGRPKICVGDSVMLPTNRPWYYDRFYTRPVIGNYVSPNRTTNYYSPDIVYDDTVDFTYTGSVQKFVVPSGVDTVHLAVWGAEGGNSTVHGTRGGKGGYSRGDLAVNGGDTLYVYIGGKGITGSYDVRGGWNGGGGITAAYSYNDGTNHFGSGGGATDISTVGGACTLDAYNRYVRPAASYNGRVIVAGGGGGSEAGNGTAGGGLSGEGANAGTQVAAGVAAINNAGSYVTLYNGGFGYGVSTSAGHTNHAMGVAGGGGWYGGGCYAYNSTSSTMQGFGGSGYIGRVNNGFTAAGNVSFPSPSGTNETGHSGNGHARIFYASDDIVYPAEIYTVTVHPEATATIHGLDTTCDSTPGRVRITFGGTAPFTYRISGDTADRVSNSYSQTLYMLPDSLTSYRITMLRDINCEAKRRNISGIAYIYKCAQAVICTGDSVTLPSGYDWYYDRELTRHLYITNMLPRRKVKYYDVPVGGGPTYEFTIFLKQHPTARIISGDASICNGDSAYLTIAFTGTAPYTYRLTGDNADRMSWYDTITVPVCPPQTSRYNITMLYDTLCSGSPTPIEEGVTVTVCGQRIICAGDTLHLPSGVWFYDQACTRPVPPDNVVSPTTTTTYYLAGEMTYDFSYTGATQVFPVPSSAYALKLEVWGAQGGYRSNASYGGKGGYSVGTINDLSAFANSNLYINVGGFGGNTSTLTSGVVPGGWNGGGCRYGYRGGGGATDISLQGTAGSTNWNTPDHLYSRLIVAGGGGSDGATGKTGMYGGGTMGGSSTESYTSYSDYCGKGGTQTYSGYSAAYTVTTYATSGLTTQNLADYGGGFGFGGGGVYYSSGYGGAGGGGWYGGSGTVPDLSGDDDRGGGGGSGYVYTAATAGNYPSGCLLNSRQYLTNAQTIAGNASFPDITGNGTETGHSGNGHARITVYSTGSYTVLIDERPTGRISVRDTACGNNGVYLHLEFTGTAPFRYRITGDTADRVTRSNTDSVYVQPSIVSSYRITMLSDYYCTAQPLDFFGMATVEVCRQQMICRGDTIYLDTTRNWYSDPLMLHPISKIQVPDTTTVYYTNTVRTFTAVVNEHPTARILTPDTSICGGSVCLRIQFTGTAPFIYRITGDTADRIAYFNNDVVCLTPTYTGIYSITKLEDAYCYGKAENFTRSMVVTVCDQTMVCAGDTVVLPAGSTWYYDASLTRPVPSNNIVTPTTATTYYTQSYHDFAYTGDVQKYVVPGGVTQVDVQVWGAQGGTVSGRTEGGRGGYSEGTLPVTPGDTLFVYVGGKGNFGASVPGGFNGGGLALSTNNRTMASGGGATDIRVNSTSLYARAIVAGGGGGGYETGTSGTGATAAYGGGLTGGTGTGSSGRMGYGGTQTAGGAAATGTNSWGGTLTPAGFGYGGYGVNTGYSNGGGGGWYGGGASIPDGGAGGGSGYVYTAATAGNYPQNCMLNSSYYMTNASTFGGNTTFESPTGGTETGHTGDGYARIQGAATYTVSVITAPTATISTGTTRVCDSATLNAVNIVINFTGTAPFTYRITGDVLDRVTNNATEVVTIHPTVSGTYQVTYLHDYYCEARPVDMQGLRTVIVCDQPIICSGSQVALPAGTWYEDVLLTRPVGGNTVSPIMTTTYYDQDTNTFTVTVRPRPSAAISGRTTICNSYDSVSLTVRFTGTLPITYRLSGERFNRTANNYTEVIKVLPRRTTTYTITQVSDQFCVGQASDLAGVAVVAVCDTITRCPGEAITLPSGTWFYDSLMTIPVGGNVVYPSTTTTYYRSLSGMGNAIDYQYTGAVQSYTVPAGVDSVFMQVWGGQGGNGGPTNLGGKGGYSEGKMAVSAGDILYVYVGGAGQGTSSTTSTSGLTIGGWNGGGNGYQSTTPRSAGGGGSDIRVNNQSLYARVIVAGGGGGNIYFNGNTYTAGCGGGTTGGNGVTNATGGTQISAGGNAGNYTNFTNATFGVGATATTSGSTVCGGGGGWYGGGAGNAAAGGSGYIYTAATASNYPAGCLLTTANYLTNAQTISGCSTFVAPDSTQETGHSGNGYARIISIISNAGSEPYTVNVYPRPMATIYGGDSICNGQTTNLIINFTGVAPFVYRLNGENQNRVCNGYTDTLVVSPTISTAYRVDMMFDQYCEARQVDLQGLATVIVCNQPVICEGQAVQLDPNKVWYIDPQLTSQLWGASVTPSATTTYYSAQGPFTVTVKPRPRASINTSVVDICDSQTVSVVINFTGTAPFVYRLTGDTADRVCNNNMEILTFMPMGSATYRMVSLYDALCEGTFLDMSGYVKATYCGEKVICGGEVVQLPSGTWFLDSACTRPIPSNTVMPSTTTTYYRYIGDTTANFTYVNDSQSFVVPAGIDSVLIQCWGASGGTGTAQGGKGGYSEGILPVQAGDILYVYVGGQGG
ncbi:MAG: hypothetical protein J5605_04235, partial [Bacteroidales bacterium]|nr:hypothetical protein [Bacteroidales bacterium]